MRKHLLLLLPFLQGLATSAQIYFPNNLRGRVDTSVFDHYYNGVEPTWLSIMKHHQQEKHQYETHFLDSLMSLMTLEEKIGQLNLPSVGFDVTGPVLSEDVESKIDKGLLICSEFMKERNLVSTRHRSLAVDLINRIDKLWLEVDFQWYTQNENVLY